MKQRIRLTESQLRNIIKEAIEEEFGVDMDDTLPWVMKKRPDLPPHAQKKFAQNIINKKARNNKKTDNPSAPNLSTFKEVQNAVREYMMENYPEDYEKGKMHYKAILKKLGFVQDGYDKYGTNAYTNGKVRVAVFYDRGDGFWVMEEADGYSNTTDNFYNTSSEMRDEFGNYGYGNPTDPWNY